MNTWTTTKPAGDTAELTVAEWFLQRGWTAHKTLGMADYDLLLQCLCEVKHDRMAGRTGNVAIETAYRGKPSGILTTGATWWAIAVGDEAYLTRAETLRDLALRHPETPAGDDRASIVRLIPLRRLREHRGVHRIALGGRQS